VSKFFNCSNCPAHCCSYEHIEVNDRDLARLARHFEVDVDTARRRYTKPARRDGKDVRILRHQKDPVFGSACRFLDLETRQCTIYDGRPEVCRAYPGLPRCGFYDFLMAERKSQDDPEHVPDFTRG
jgi:Fe-S-cluster containining protein